MAGMATGQIRHPVPFIIPMEGGNGLLHSFLPSEAEASLRRLPVGIRHFTAAVSFGTLIWRNE